MPGEKISISFTVEITDATPDKLPIINNAFVDYTDGHYFQGSPHGERHPPIMSNASFYPIGKPAVYPNPFSPINDGVVKFDNIVPNSVISIHTISGEHVRSIRVDFIRAQWDGRNRYGYVVSPGLYYFAIRNLTSNQVQRGKIFVVGAK